MYADTITLLKSYIKRVKALHETLDVENRQEKVRALEEKMAAPGFWDDNDAAQGVIGTVKQIKAEIDPALGLGTRINDTLELAILGEAESDEATLQEIEAELPEIQTSLDELELKSTLNEPHDAYDAFLSIHAGAGGTESCDWAMMLERQYLRFCEKQGFTVDLIDRLLGEEAGIRSATYSIHGPYAYGFLKAEVGVHRLVRISPFDAKGRRHTSFAAVDVTPELPDSSKEFALQPSELRIDTYRAGGAGGQHVNKTDSAVRITHEPTGIVVQCQNERSQHSNKATALKMLRARLILEEEKKRDAELAKLYGEKGEIAFGAQIRSYTLQPFTLVKDHRTHHENGNANAVLDGELMPFIEAYLRQRRKRLG